MNLRLIHQDPGSNIIFVSPPCEVEVPLDPPHWLDGRTQAEVIESEQEKSP